uniref:Uncharacterized protein n=2 Tax=Meloidogyne TaxID=189290 RepID=A0A6V7UXC0_MELEN|nr:unnamed protein product [Meloidogyne enterolobii]CAD2167284.1 unnamed protein product [Meloidogyne enterolobii]
MSTLTGLVSCAISSLCFGSMYVGVRVAGDPGDGMVVQWIVSFIFLNLFLEI